MPILKAPVDEDTKKRFAAAAKRAGLSESELLRKLAIQAIERDGSLEKALEPNLGNVKPDRITAWVPAFLKAGVFSRAKGAGMSVSKWVAALIQSNLMADPVLTDRELRMLEVVGRELNAVGRNVNQIARHLNAGLQSTDPISFESLNNLPRAIANARQAIDALVIAKHRSWGRSEE